jgi:hypothetical protein
MENNLQWKTTSNIKSDISQQPLVRSEAYVTKPNFTNVSNDDDLRIKMTFNGRQPPNKDDLQWKTTFNGRQLQILKVIYLNNHWSALYKILN